MVFGKRTPREGTNKKRVLETWVPIVGGCNRKLEMGGGKQRLAMLEGRSRFRNQHPNYKRQNNGRGFKVKKGKIRGELYGEKE